MSVSPKNNHQGITNSDELHQLNRFQSVAKIRLKLSQSVGYSCHRQSTAWVKMLWDELPSS